MPAKNYKYYYSVHSLGHMAQQATLWLLCCIVWPFSSKHFVGDRKHYWNLILCKILKYSVQFKIKSVLMKTMSWSFYYCDNCIQVNVYLHTGQRSIEKLLKIIYNSLKKKWTRSYVVCWTLNNSFSAIASVHMIYEALDSNVIENLNEMIVYVNLFLPPTPPSLNELAMRRW